ncbi:MAG TPA: LysM domain-containing protein [Candidatus Saccharimonadales bacterium]|nr:LysM domain-containing protein [Candidatus Saccharimonadales bacterium]
MKLTAILAGLLSAVVFSIAGTHHAYAQAQTGQNSNNQAKPLVTVTVAAGDTLTSIASTHNTTYPRIFDANDKISDPNLIYTGDTLRIPDASENLPDRALPADYVAVNPLPSAPSQPVSQVPAAAPAPAPVVQSAPVSGCGDNQYANFIYMHESGCRTTAVNPGGCYGIGQACPGSKIAYCGADYTCQNAFFTAYANKYGGWAGAYAFWVAHGWW